MSAYTEGEFAAVERAGNMFDETVERHLSGAAVQVDIEWVEAPEAVWQAYADEPNAEPYVIIDGKTAEQHYLDVTASEDLMITEDDKVLGAIEFGDMLAMMWQDTLNYYTVELPALDVELDLLVVEKYRAKAIENGGEEGILDLLGVDEAMLLRVAKQNAKDDLKIWADAVEAKENAEEESKEKLELLSHLANGIKALRDASKTVHQG